MEAAPPTRERRGLKWLTLGALLVGLVVASYLTYGHLQLTHGTKSFESLCNISTTINCDTVNTSDYSELFGLPIALFAVPTYVVLAFLILISLGKTGDAERRPLELSTLISSLTVLTSLVLAYFSIFEIKAVCLFCIALYTVNITAFVCAWIATRQPIGSTLKGGLSAIVRSPALIAQAAVVLVVTSSVAFGVESMVKSRLLAQTTEAVKRTMAQGARGNSGTTAGEGPTISPKNATYGPADAKVTVVEFADFQCGYCKRMSYAVKALKEEYGDRVRFVFKHFPMSPSCNNAVKNDKHPYACEAARAGVCAQRQNKFWEFHDLTFKNQKNLKTEDLIAYATAAGLEVGAFRQCLTDVSALDEVKEDIEDSKPFQITGTPRIYINGREFRGIVPKEALEAAILQALGETSKPQAKVEPSVTLKDPLTAPSSVIVSVGGKAVTIDAFEASRGDKNEAVSAPDKKPYNGASWYDAEKACKAAGKRMCSQQEWISVCQNAAIVDDDQDGKWGDDLIEGNEFSYSDFYDPKACNDGQEDPRSGKVAFTGNFPQCQTPTGVFDLNGNVQEWVGFRESEALLMGGTMADKEKASCFRIQDTFGPGFANKATGFRCCQN